MAAAPETVCETRDGSSSRAYRHIGAACSRDDKRVSPGYPPRGPVQMYNMSNPHPAKSAAMSGIMTFQ